MADKIINRSDVWTMGHNICKHYRPRDAHQHNVLFHIITRTRRIHGYNQIFRIKRRQSRALKQNRHHSIIPMAHLLHIHIVTYAGNAHTLPHAVTAARRAWPASPVTILDDARHPVPPSMQQDLENHPQIQYRPTHWERGGNLRGRTCLRGLLAEYKRSLRQTEAPYVLKLDETERRYDPDSCKRNRSESSHR